MGYERGFGIFITFGNIARSENQGDVKKWALLEEMFWRQKLREVWLKEGGMNTKYFHRMLYAHLSRNWISKMKVGEKCLIEEEVIETQII